MLKFFGNQFVLILNKNIRIRADEENPPPGVSTRELPRQTWENLKQIIFVQLPLLERVRRIELPWPAWEAGVLPLNYTRNLKKHW